jgi:hypothetical protein
MTDEELPEAVRRIREPDGDCLHCRRPADRHHPVGPLWVTIREPDGELFLNAFCCWECLGQWAARQAGGVFVVDKN